MSQGNYKSQLAASYISGGNAGYLELLYEHFLNDPQSVPEEWREYFADLPRVNGTEAPDIVHSDVRHKFQNLARSNRASRMLAGNVEQLHKQTHVLDLIAAYRSYGHMKANLDPLGLAERPVIASLELNHHNLAPADMETVFDTGSFLGHRKASLREIHQKLEQTYCGTIGVEYMHITDTEQTTWIQQRLEPCSSTPDYNAEQKRHLLQRILAAEGLERYLGRRYVGQKRFSLEGGGSLIPLVEEVIQRSGAQGVREVVMGMAHRGRLNVLINILGKSPEELFKEFEGKLGDMSRSGDVKYHMGFSSDIATPGGGVHLALSFNPSHLEIINPVVEGSVRARQERRGDKLREHVMPILVHGDAAFAGQGVVMEILNMSQARGYSTGGTVHVICNNQIGFTTSSPLDARSTLYCSDVAKMVQAPVFHVNTDDPEAVLFVAQIAADFRVRFKKDVVIDLVCYRRHGHNEADEPAATQPIMYQAIRKHPTVTELYREKLFAENICTADEVEQWVDGYRDKLDAGQPVAELIETSAEASKLAIDWSKYIGHSWTAEADTGYDIEELRELARALEVLPEDFTLQPQVDKLHNDRIKMTTGEVPINWGYAELLAYATLLKHGHDVRLSGQDCQRGTFSHRHCVLHDYKKGEMYVPLHNVGEGQGEFRVINSILSELAVLGFEYGYATADPEALVMWEAQFGDFANGAQMVIDQFISSGEQKWGRLCGLVMLLPHGFEGQGPEHSSARLERYLQLCAQHNMQVCVPSTPAQCFHMLRRQVLRPFRAPLIVMTPKSLLRHRLAVSSMEDLANGQFQLVIPEMDDIDVKQVRKVVICSGKVYYDLLEERRANNQTDVALVRIEQLYPFPEEELSAILKTYTNATRVVWCQEEPKNQGAWYSVRHRFHSSLAEGQTLHYAGRAPSASPAVGSPNLHREQQITLVKQALS